MLISISFAYQHLLRFFPFCSITLLCGFFSFLKSLSPLVLLSHFICTTLPAGGGEPRLLGNQAALGPRIAPSQPL